MTYQGRLDGAENFPNPFKSLNKNILKRIGIDSLAFVGGVTLAEGHMLMFNPAVRELLSTHPLLLVGGIIGTIATLYGLGEAISNDVRKDAGSPNAKTTDFGNEDWTFPEDSMTK